MKTYKKQENVIKSINGFGEICKQCFKVINKTNAPKSDTVLIIWKYVLTENFELYDNYGFKVVKQFKNKRLYLQVFSIKLDTLMTSLNSFEL